MLRKALTPALPSELISFILRHPPSVLIICLPRETFLSSLCQPGTIDDATLHRWQQLSNVAVSKKLALYFVPTVTHLRGLLAKLSLDNVASLFVYGLMSLHEDTSQWSAQGIGNSLSALADACKTITICEEKHEDYDDPQDESRESRKSKRIKNAWQQQLPLLGGNEKRDGLGDIGYSGRTVEMMRIVGRWFRFEEGSWVIDEEE